MKSDFKKLMSARFLFTFAVQMQSILLGWQMYVLTHDPLYLGFVGLAEAIPAIGLALFAGYIVDRSRPLVIYRRLVYVSFLSAIVMFASQLTEIDTFSILNFHLSQNQKVIALFVSSLLTGSARAFSQPVMYSIVPRLIERSRLSQSSAWMSSVMQIARISGPALGGILYGLLGISATSLIVCLMLVIAFGCISSIQTKIAPLEHSKVHASRKEEFLSGARFVLKHPILLPAMSLDMVSVFFGGVTSLLPIYAAQILMIGPQGMGLLRAAPAFGAALTSFWLTTFEIREKAGRYLLVAITGFGVCILVFALSRSYPLSLFALFASGAFDSVSMVIRTAAVQLSSPDFMRGKISAVNSIFIGSSNEIGEFESGVAAKLMGTVPAAVFGGIVCLITVGSVAMFFPRLRKLNLAELKNN
jgi:MFS family permease